MFSSAYCIHFLFHLQSIFFQNVQDDEVFNADKEVYTTYTAVGSSEDIHDIPPLSVQELLNNFEDKRSSTSAQQKPLPIPRKFPRVEGDVETQTGEKQQKPKPSPRNFNSTNTTDISKELSDKLQLQQSKNQCEENSFPTKTKPSKSPPLTSPKPKTKATKPIPKVKLLTHVSITNPPLPPSTDSTTSTCNTGELSPTTDTAKPLEVHNQLYNKLLENNIAEEVKPSSSPPRLTSVNTEQDPVDSTKMAKQNPIKQTSTKQNSVKQTSTKQSSVKQSSTKQPHSSIAYSVVILQPEDASVNTQTDEQNYETVYSEADEDVVVQSPTTPTSSADYLTPVDAIEVISDKVEKVSLKDKRKKYNNKKSGISKSMAEKKSRLSSADELKRRQSLPEFLHGEDKEKRSMHEYEDIDFKKTPKNANVDDVNITSPPASDEEGWNSDEFDSSSADDEELVAIDQPIPKLVSLSQVTWVFFLEFISSN